LILFRLFVGVSRRSWIGIWVALELNTLSFLGFLRVEDGARYDAGIKYFLVQSCSSFLYIFISLFNRQSATCLAAIFIIMVVKLGGAPFHFWVPIVAGGVPWKVNVILLILQKVIPLSVLRSVYNPLLSKFYWFVRVARCLAGGLGGWNELNLRKLLGFSSINHSGWIVACGMVGSWAWHTYFLFYGLLRMSLIGILAVVGIEHINDISIKGSWWERFTLCLTLLSLAGVPPLTGFFPKWLALEQSLEHELRGLIGILLVRRVILLRFYLRITLGCLSWAEDIPKLLSRKEIIRRLSLLVRVFIGGLLAVGVTFRSLQLILL